MIPTGQEEDGEDQRIILTSQLTSDSSRRTTLTLSVQPAQGDLKRTAEEWQTKEATRSSWEPRRNTGSPWRWQFQEKGNAAPWIGQRVADWMDSLRSRTANLKCDNEPSILALAQEIRRGEERT